jgi:pimeloyl-ACP methyl ester carboxylesterase
LVLYGFNHGGQEVNPFFLLRNLLLPLLFAISVISVSSAQNAPPSEAFEVLRPTQPAPRITPYLQYQLDEAWREDEAEQRIWESIRTEQELLKLQTQLRESLLTMIGGLPDKKTELHPHFTGKIQMEGFSIEKLIFQSIPGIYVTALVYVPNNHAAQHPAVLVPAGHATNGKIHYQTLCARLANRGYLVIAWDPIGQGERSQFWDAKAHKSRYNLVCGEHAVLGNLAYLAGANLARWEIWDGIRAVDYLLTRPDVDAERISITGTSGGGTQTTLIAALDPRIKVVIPSCYITSLPMRMGNRIFADPDSDPEQDLFGMLSNHVGYTGLLLLIYPRPLMVASAVLDFFPIEGARKSFREAQRVYERFDHSDRIAMTEGYHSHQYSDQNQEAALDFLDHFNKMPVQHGLVSPPVLPDKDLLCTSSGQVLIDESDARPLSQLIREFYLEKKNTSSTSLEKGYSESKAPRVDTWSLREFDGSAPSSDELLWEFVGTTKFQNIVIDKYLLHHSRLLQMPLLYIHIPSKETSHTVLWFKEAGKASSSDWPEIEKLIQSGYGIVTFDFRGLGETRMNYSAVSSDVPQQQNQDFDHSYMDPLSGVLANHVYNSLLTGRPYFLQMIDDAVIVRRFAKDKLSVNIDSITAPGDAYPLATSVAQIFHDTKLLPKPDATHLRWSELIEKQQEVWPIEYLLPGGAYITHQE